MKKRITVISIFFSTILISIGLIAQTSTTITGKVIDEGGGTLAGVKVSVNDGKLITTKRDGSFELEIAGEEPTVTTVWIEKKGYQKKEWRWVSATEIEITAIKLTSFEGQVLDKNSKPIKNAIVKIQQNNLNLESRTDTSGYFHTFPPHNVEIGSKAKFFVNGKQVATSDLSFSGDDHHFVQIRNQEANLLSIDKPDGAEEDTIDEADDDFRPMTVTVLFEDETPAGDINVLVADLEYNTDESGKFIVNDSEATPEQVQIEGYETMAINYDEDNHDLVVIIVKSEVKPKAFPLFDTTVEDTVVVEYREDFNVLLRQLEIRKTALTETGVHLRDKMEEIVKKLNSNSDSLTEAQKEILNADLEHIQSNLIKIETEYEDAQLETRKVMEQMRNTLKQKDTEIEEIETELKRDILLATVIISILVVLAAISYLIARRIRKQKDEIEKAYENIRSIGDIGKKITATLDFENLIQTIHANVNNLVDATVFGIGITNESVNKIEFKKYIEKGETQSYFFESLDDYNKFSVWCLRNQREVIINDLPNEYDKYIDASSFKPTEDMPQSLMYLPLVFEGQAIGVITVQSYKKNAYKAIDTTILQTLASYISVALSNSNAFEVIKETNKNITNSIRYAQTIQEAILPSEREMSDYLGEHFVIYRPKDIVSGDFYWFGKVLDERGQLSKVFVAVVDCTGHGVPGAFMSMIGKTLLDEIINQHGIHDTAQILEELNISVKQALKQDDNINDDGMDVCLCCLEKAPEGTKVIFTGAKRPLYYFTKSTGELQILKGDSKTIGGIQRKKRKFTKQELLLQPGDCLYLTSDGMVDQSNIEREKFGTKRFLEVLNEIASLHVPEQERLLEAELDSHQEEAAQRDDILIMGIKV